MINGKKRVCDQRKNITLTYVITDIDAELSAKVVNESFELFSLHIFHSNQSDLNIM